MGNEKVYKTYTYVHTFFPLTPESLQMYKKT